MPMSKSPVEGGIMELNTMLTLQETRSDTEGCGEAVQRQFRAL